MTREDDPRLFKPVRNRADWIRWSSAEIEHRIADFERRYPHNTAEAQRARRARLLDVELDRMERADAARDRRRSLAGWLAALRGWPALNAWKQRRYAARRAGRRAIVDHWLARRPL